MVAIVCCVAMAATVAGCGGGSGGTRTSQTSPPTTSAAGSVARGKALYTSKGCSSCHSLDGAQGVGPTWKGLAGSRVRLSDGKTVTADRDYLVASIVDPDKQTVAGFQPGVMSATVPPGSISTADAQALASFITSLR
jgi:cytochrome c oxidase subunit 2